MIPGVDVHAAYGRINWKLVAAAGYRFVWAKSAEGNEPHKDDLTWQRNTAEAQANGLAAGVYFFPYPLPPGAAGRGPLEQAERFHSRVGGFGSQPGELAPVIDAEWPAPQDWAKWGCRAQQLSDWLREHCEAVTLLFGRLPVIYTYPHWWRTLAAGADVSWASRYRLWLADYSWTVEGHPVAGWAPPKLSWVRPTWVEWAACQHSADGSLVRVPGIPACPVDRNVIRDEATLAALTGVPQAADTQPELYRVESEPAIVHAFPPSLICERCGFTECRCPQAA